ncbi:MAG: sugar transferase [Candidatus Uhrbacteria bacterium]|nr:sugar transferase [Candidatus Uhrbacteria bacterium]
MRRIDLSFTALKLPLDFLALLGAAVTAYALRFSDFFTAIRPILTEVPFSRYLISVGLFALMWMALFAVAGLYSTHARRAWNELGRIILSSTTGIMVVIATVFFRREVTTSRFIIVAVWGIAILYVWLGRLLLRLIRYALLRANIGHQRFVIIGNSRAAQELANFYKTHPAIGYTVIKTLKQWTEVAQQELQRLMERGKLDGILLADPEIPKNQALDIIAFAEEHHLTFRYLADLFAASFTRIEVSTAGGIPIIEVKRTPLDGWGRIAKRFFDLMVSIILLTALSPILLLTAIAVKLDSPGRVLFSRLPDHTKTERIGEGGKPFHYFKFRSMREGEHFSRYDALAHLDLRRGPLVKLKNDPRVTRVGRFIRKWSIDELPELWLVLIGRMSLVGPRPHLPEEVNKYKSHHRRVLAIKPGITGLAQISGRSNLDFEDEVRLDTWYIENWSLWLDLYILLKTPWAVIAHRQTEEGV